MTLQKQQEVYNMKKYLLNENKKRILDQYVNTRCRKLQEQSKWNPANWDYSYDNINKRMNQLGNIPVAGKAFGMVGGAMDIAKGAYEGDWGRVAQGATGMVFSGTGGGSVVKNLTKKGIKNYTGKALAKDLTKDIAKNVVKAPVKNIAKTKANQLGTQIQQQVQGSQPIQQQYQQPTQQTQQRNYA